MRQWTWILLCLPMVASGLLVRAQDDARTLQPEQLVQSDIEAGATHDWLFEGQSDQIVFAVMNSVGGRPDPYLKLRSPSGGTLVENDNLYRLNAVIGPYILPEDGTYTLQAQNDREDGYYTLTLYLASMPPQPPADSPQRAADYITQGTAAIDAYDYVTAHQAFEQALKKESGSIDALRERARTHAAIGNLDQALLDAAHAFERAPDDARSLAILGYVYWQRGQKSLALQNLDRAVEQAPNDAYVRYFRGRVYAAQNRYLEAEEEYTRALELEPSVPLYFARADVYEAIDADQLTILDYIAAAQHAPDNPNVWRRWGNLYREKDSTQAYDIYAIGLSLNPDFDAIRYEMGIKAFRADKYGEALALFKKVAEGSNYHRRDMAYRYMAYIYYNREDYKNALSNYDRAIALNPDEPHHYSYRGDLYRRKLKDYAAAWDDYSTAITLSPENADFYNRRGLVSWTLEDYERASQDFSRAIAVDPNLAVAYANLADAYYALERYAEARLFYARFALMKARVGEEISDRDKDRLAELRSRFCTVQPKADDTALYSGPGTQYGVKDVMLSADQLLDVGGKASEDAQGDWWWLLAGGWVSADQVTVVGDCEAVEAVHLLAVAPSCTVRPAMQTINVRSTPTTNASIPYQLSHEESAFAIGQIVENAQYTWWQLGDGNWVRSDVVEEAADCANLTFVTLIE